MNNNLKYLLNNLLKNLNKTIDHSINNYIVKRIFFENYKKENNNASPNKINRIMSDNNINQTEENKIKKILNLPNSEINKTSFIRNITNCTDVKLILSNLTLMNIVNIQNNRIKEDKENSEIFSSNKTLSKNINISLKRFKNTNTSKDSNYIKSIFFYLQFLIFKIFSINFSTIINEF
jgi:hypothetical protein